MQIFKAHFKKSDSWMYCCWVKHNGFGLKPRLRINKTFQGIPFYFLFTWWKLEWYWAKSRKQRLGGK